jgi:hypothetical protein
MQIVAMRGCLFTTAKIFAAILLVLIVLILLLFKACVSQDEVTKVVSPDGAIEAILIETNGGATTSFGYILRLRATQGIFRRSKKFGEFYAATRSGCAYGVDLRWSGPHSLRVSYLDARSANVDASATVDGKPVEIQVTPGVTNSSAPCGGMDYNRRGRPYG